MYCLSRRAGQNGSGLPSAATRSRPLINTRDEARAAARGLLLLCVMVSESNMSEASIAQLIERYRAEHDLPLSASQVAQADLAYHDVHRGRGPHYQLQRSGAVERTARDIDIFEAKPSRRLPAATGGRAEARSCRQLNAMPDQGFRAGRGRRLTSLIVGGPR